MQNQIRELRLLRDLIFCRVFLFVVVHFVCWVYAAPGCTVVSELSGAVQSVWRCIKTSQQDFCVNQVHRLKNTVKPFNLAALKVGDFACKIILAYENHII